MSSSSSSPSRAVLLTRPSDDKDSAFEEAAKTLAAFKPMSIEVPTGVRRPDGRWLETFRVRFESGARCFYLTLFTSWYGVRKVEIKALNGDSVFTFDEERPPHGLPVNLSDLCRTLGVTLDSSDIAARVSHFVMIWLHAALDWLDDKGDAENGEVVRIKKELSDSLSMHIK